MNQDELGAAVGLPQPRVSDWEGDAHQEVEEALELLGRIDVACGRRRGWLLVEADFIDADAAEVDVTRAIEADERLDRRAKDLVLYAYRWSIDQAQLAEAKRVGSKGRASVERARAAERAASEPPADGGPDTRRVS